MKQNKKQVIKTPRRHAVFQSNQTSCVHRHTGQETADDLRISALKTEANKICVWLYPPFSAS